MKKASKKQKKQETPVLEVHPVTHKIELSGIDLYRTLKEKGFPQGGNGNWYQDPSTGERYYIPQPDEVYTQFIADPSLWQKMTDAMARAWIDNKDGR